MNKKILGCLLVLAFAGLLLAGCVKKQAPTPTPPAPSVVVTQYVVEKATVQATRTPTAAPTKAPSLTPPAPSPAPSPVASVASGRVSVSIRFDGFVPAEIRVKAGSTVAWVNEDSVTHIIQSDSQTFSSLALQNGDEYEHVFAVPGYFDYYCALHPSVKGKIIVE